MRHFKGILPALSIGLTFMLATPILAFCQQRSDDELPKLTEIPKSLSNLTGWTKNNIGKWSSLPNGLPQYDYNYKSILPYCENLLKMEIAQMSVEHKNYFCVAKFKKYIYGDRMEKVTYHAEYWLFELPSESLEAKDTTVITKTYQTFLFGGELIILARQATWNDIIRDVKRTLVERNSELENALNEKKSFFVQYRNDIKNKKVQFMIGTQIQNEYQNELDFNLDRCSMNEINLELSNMYYEVSDATFRTFFSKIL